MSQEPSGWQETGRKKREAVTALLPEHWRLQVVPPANEVLDGVAYSQKSLSEREIEITESHSATQLLDLLKTGMLSSVEVTAAFCRRATIAHQLVGELQMRSMDCCWKLTAWRPTVLAKSCSMMLSHVPKSLMHTTARTAKPVDCSMA